MSFTSSSDRQSLLPARRDRSREQFSLEEQHWGRYSSFMTEIAAYKDQDFSGVEAL